MRHSLLNNLSLKTTGTLLSLALGLLPLQAQEIGAPKEQAAASQDKPLDKALQLEVFVNDEPTKLVATFRQDGAGQLYAKAKELRDVGIEPANAKSEAEEVPLAQLQGVQHRYDAATQTLYFTANEQARTVKSYEAQQLERNNDKLVQTRDFGAVVNYALFAAASRDMMQHSNSFQGVSATFDARFFGPLGTFAQSGLIGNATNFARPNDIRLDSTWSYSDEDTMITSKIGDYISGGLAWSRPIRMGGLQLQRNFGLRSDLITHALPSASGTALVPSTVDVYVNNMRAYSQDVPSGPFRIANIPVAASNGTARIVVRDVSGRSSETTQNFFVSPNLLGKGMFDFSAQTGYARYDYGLQSHNYSNRLVAMASARYGLSNDFTLEAHTESSARFGLAGLGLVTALDKRHLFTIAGSFSQFEAQRGGQVFASYETNYKGFFLGLSTQRSLGHYMDLAAVTAKPIPLSTFNSGSPLNMAGQGNSVISQYSSQNPFALSLLPMKAIDRATLGLPLAGLKASLNFSHVHMLSAENTRAHISSASLNMTLNAETSFFATAFMDRGDKRNYGLFAGLSMQLDKATYANLGLGNDRNGTTFTAELARPQSQDIDTWGYRIRDMEGKTSYRTAQASYRSKVGLGEVTLAQQAQGAYGTAYIEGGLATAGGGVFATNRIDDGFAVVKTGVKNAEVFHENRLVGRTNEAGRLILPNLRSNETNRITLNPNSLPITAAIDTTKTIALPKDKGAVVVDFGVTEFPQAALVSFIDPKNVPISAGTVGTREDGTNFIVGHEGKSYLMKLNAQNNVTLKNEKMSCTASFAYAAENDKLVKIPHILCR